MWRYGEGMEGRRKGEGKGTARSNGTDREGRVETALKSLDGEGR